MCYLRNEKFFLLFEITGSEEKSLTYPKEDNSFFFPQTRRRAEHLCIKRGKKKSKYNPITLPWTRVRDVTETITGLLQTNDKKGPDQH
jgi:hypothetical protein